MKRARGFVLATIVCAVALAADQLAGSGLDPAIVQLIEKWVATTKNGDVAGRMALYGERVDIFYTQPNLSKANVEREIRKTAAGYSGFPVLELSNLTWRQVRADMVQVEFDKDYQATKTTGGSVAGRVHSMLTLLRTGQSWRIVGERDLKTYPSPHANTPVTATQSNLPELQKVHYVFLANTGPGKDDLSSDIGTDFIFETRQQIEKYTCFKLAKPAEPTPGPEHNPAYATFNTDVDVEPLGGLFGAPGWQLFYHISVANSGGTLWDGGTIVFVHGPAEGQSTKPDTVLAAVNLLKAVAKDACPNFSSPSLP